MLCVDQHRVCIFQTEEGLHVNTAAANDRSSYSFNKKPSCR